MTTMAMATASQMGNRCLYLISESKDASPVLLLPFIHGLLPEDAEKGMAGGPSPSVVSGERGAPGGTRTRDTRFRKPLLYPLSYRGTR